MRENNTNGQPVGHRAIVWFEICDFQSQQVDSSSHLKLPITEVERRVTKGFGRRLCPPFHLRPSPISCHSTLIARHCSYRLRSASCETPPESHACGLGLSLAFSPTYWPLLKSHDITCLFSGRSWPSVICGIFSQFRWSKTMLSIAFSIIFWHSLINDLFS